MRSVFALLKLWAIEIVVLVLFAFACVLANDCDKANAQEIRAAWSTHV
jgi:hypothetical protein